MTALDLFCGAGGSSTGLALLDRTVVGVDNDRDACHTHHTAGHPTIRADLTGPVPVSGRFEMVWASPPCTAFSMAGKGAGRPNGYPWQGSRTSQFRSIGNAVPPPVAAAVAGAALGVDWRPAVAAYLTELYREPCRRIAKEAS